MSVMYSQLGNCGRLGNICFQLAATIGYGIKHDMPALFPEWEGFKAFKYPFITVKESPGFPPYREPHFHYAEIPKMEDVDLFGYYQSKKYWEHCDLFIREIFEPAEEIKEKLKEYEELLSGNTCALHIRLTDYIRLKDYHYNLPLEYYQKGMELISADKYLVFSDDIEWCKQNFNNPFCEFIETGDVYLDFFLMAQCKNFIIANSSYSYWSSFLCKHEDKQIIAPKNWFAEKNAHANTNDLYRTEWKLI